MNTTSHVCPVCEGCGKWHRDGHPCGQPFLKPEFGVICNADHTICLVCIGHGRITYDWGTKKG